MNRDRRDFSSGNRNHHPRRGGRRNGGRFRGGRRGGGGGGNRFNAEPPDEKQDMIIKLQGMLSSFNFIDPNRIKNVQMFTDMVCGSNSQEFLGCNPDSNEDVITKFSLLSVQLVHCASVWPTETPLYAALTLLIHETFAMQLPEGEPATYAHRCLSYALLLLCRDMDLALIDSDPDAFIRCRCLIQYLILAAHLKMLPLFPSSNSDHAGTDDDATTLIVPAAIQQTALPSVTALLQAIVAAAQQADSRRLPIAFSLCLLLLDVSPFLQHSVDTTWIQQYIVEPVKEIIERNYQSQFEPGLGRFAILLQNPVLEADGEDDNDDEEDDDDDEASSPVCDSLQDALRSLQSHMGSKPTQLATFRDTPWKQLNAPGTFDENSQELAFTKNTEQSVELLIFPRCKSLTALLTNNMNVSLSKQPALGIMGRFPVFGPPGLDDDDGDDGEEEKMDETETTVDPRLKSFQENYTEADRYFLGELIRDILFTQHPHVSDTGIERGDSKKVAEKVWGVRSMHASDGMEYCILETLFTVVLVAEHHWIYASRVILELIKLEPKFYTTAMLTAVSNIYEDYMPSFTPRSRTAVARWLAFHLTQTSYQWPAAYWKHWEDATGTRALFCEQVRSNLTDYVSSVQTMIEDCFPDDSQHPAKIKVRASPTQTSSDLVSELQPKIMPANPDELLEHLQSRDDIPNKVDALISALIPIDEASDVLGEFAMRLSKNLFAVSSLIETDRSAREAEVLHCMDQVSISPSQVQGFIQVLISTKAVSTQGVLSWLIRPDHPNQFSCWWEIALVALHQGLQGILVQNGNNQHAEVLSFLDPLLSSTLRNISSLLCSSETQAKGKCLPVEQIELVEGFKYLLCGAETFYLSLPLVEDSGVDLKDSWNESTVSGQRLASLLDADSSPAVSLFRSVLERL